jgi:hypothetical protein
MAAFPEVNLVESMKSLIARESFWQIPVLDQEKIYVNLLYQHAIPIKVGLVQVHLIVAKFSIG